MKWKTLNGYYPSPQMKPFDPSSLCYPPFDHYRKWKWTIQLASLAYFLFFLPAWALYLAPGSNVYAFTEIAGGIVREKGVFFPFFSPFLFFLLCNLLPSETINAHSTSTSRHSFDVYSGSGPLSFSAACCSLCLSSSLYPPLYPFLFPSLGSLRLLYNQIIKRIVDKMILPGN